MTKRIAMISDHASPLALPGGVDSGGQNVYVGQLARHLARLGYEVDVFTRREHELVPEIVDWLDGVRVINISAGPSEYIPKEHLLQFMPDFCDEMVRFMQSQPEPYDMVHANFFLSALVAMELKRSLGLPFVVTFHALGRVRRQHQGDSDHFGDERFEIEERAVVEAEHIIAECPQDKEDLIRLYNADSSEISIVPCGFDETEMMPINKMFARIALGLHPDEKVILQLGRMVPRKGVDNVIRAVGSLKREHEQIAHLLVVGGESDEPDPELTPEIGRLQKIAEREDVADQVSFVGRRGREVLKNYYSAADIFVSTPWYEPFGITPIEAMACGTPVIGSNVGGIKFSVRDGETGYLVPPRDPKTLAERIAYLYRNPKVLRLFSQQAVERANDLFSWERMAISIAAIIEEHLPEGSFHHAGYRETLALVDASFKGLQDALSQSQRLLRESLTRAASSIEQCLLHGGKVLVCGNGGSAADASHFAAELIGRFKIEGRRALPALALNTDLAVLTSWSNDYDFGEVFARQVEALAQPGDILIGISTSGQSRNIVAAFRAAQRLGVTTLALLGKDGGDLVHLADLPLVVPSQDTAHIQEVHILLLHLVCELVEQQIVASDAEQTSRRIISMNLAASGAMD